MSSIKLFTDDSRVWHKIIYENDIRISQQDLTELEKWSATWLLKFNTSKCKVMNVGHKGETRYFLHDPINNSLEQLEHTNLEKDLGVWINNDMKWSENCGKAIKNRCPSLV